MQNLCPSCGAETFPGTRFCRRCGSPVRETPGATGDVSLQASTVPLHRSDEARATEGLAGGDGRAPGETARVSRAELENLLRRQEANGRTHATVNNATREAAAHDPEATLSAPPVTRPEAPAAELDEELTITVARAGGEGAAEDFEATHDFEATFPASPVTRVSQGVEAGDAFATREASQFPGFAPARADSAPLIVPAPSHAPPPSDAPPQSAPAPAGARSRWPLVAAVCAAVLLVGGVALVGWVLLRRASLDNLPTQGQPSPPTPEAAQRFEEKMAEAEALLAQGNMDGALARLREANEIDPANTRAHRRLGELLLAAGSRREAIEEFRAVTRNAPDDAGAWRQLAAAQFAEGLYRDAADSYKRLAELAGASADPNDLLAYADSLRLSGRNEEARSVYERVASSPLAEAAAAARQRLSEFAQASPTPATTPRPGETPEAQAVEGETASNATTPTEQPTPEPTPQPTPTPAQPERAESATPAERYRRGVELWSSNRSAALGEFRAAASAGNPDAHYYLGLAYVEGRNTSTLKRAEVVAALEHFQRAQRGQFAAQARRHAQQLEKEFDRFRK